jgi:type III restriction enzyme
MAIVVPLFSDAHLLSFEDAWHRAKGMARYAAKHADRFGRIELIQLDGDVIERLDLKDEQTRKRVLAVSTNEHLKELFDKV